ncbi:hypothetical protein AS96_14150 [Microbacterium sp. MRS-1]|nr:hypothetical protein AS96_14150 [Microbacterium sp. MRS-1]
MAEAFDARECGMSGESSSHIIAGHVYAAALNTGRSHARSAVSSALALTKSAGVHLDSSVFLRLALRELDAVEDAQSQARPEEKELARAMTDEGRSYNEVEAVLEYLRAAAQQNVNAEAVIHDAYADYEAAHADPSLDAF